MTPSSRGDCSNPDQRRRREGLPALEDAEGAPVVVRPKDKRQACRWSPPRMPHVLLRACPQHPLPK
eukprot:4032685-Pyramimonas_sp.AAC.1